jgi:hypothetical protein
MTTRTTDHGEDSTFTELLLDGTELDLFHRPHGKPSCERIDRHDASTGWLL